MLTQDQSSSELLVLLFALYTRTNCFYCTVQFLSALNYLSIMQCYSSLNNYSSRFVLIPP